MNKVSNSGARENKEKMMKNGRKNRR